MPILGNVYGGQCKVFDRSVNGEYTFAKLLEHSWWHNTFVNAFSEFLYNNPGRVSAGSAITPLNPTTSSSTSPPLSLARIIRKSGAKTSRCSHALRLTSRLTASFSSTSTRANSSTLTNTRRIPWVVTAGLFIPCRFSLRLATTVAAATSTKALATNILARGHGNFLPSLTNRPKTSAKQTSVSSKNVRRLTYAKHLQEIC